MITPMMKYSLVLYHKEYTDFLARLQELGLVDVTTSGWEPTREQRELISQIEQHRKAVEQLRQLEKKAAEQAKVTELTETKSAVSQATTHAYPSVEAAFETYQQAVKQHDALNTEYTRVRKECEELRPWGEFDPTMLDRLHEAGIRLHFYRLHTAEFESVEAQWLMDHAVQEVYRDATHSYVAVAVSMNDPLLIAAQELRLPEGNITQKEAEEKALEVEITAQTAIMTSCIPMQEAFKQQLETLSDQLHLERVSASGQREMEGRLILLEGWATTENQEAVDALLDELGTFYIKERPTPEDTTPVLLKNRAFPRLFEAIGNFYALPKYGTMDLTPYFGPFYMLFFGFCLGDAGYGTLFVLTGLIMALKLKGNMRQYGWLVFACGWATVLFGLLSGNFFGVELSKVSWFANFKDDFLDPGKLFNLSIALGFVHLLFGMVLRLISTTRQFGIKYALAPAGWFLLVVTSLTVYLLPQIGITAVGFDSPAYLALASIGLFLMLFFNSPGKNVFLNFGTGIWNTYNDVTGLLGDVLSYIRLFALCLAGGVLGLVFNDLAIGLSPDIPVLREIVIVLIFLFGHAINIFMSSLSSFVHPMRLTFVEFYKNAGFEAGQRVFTPLKKSRI